MGHWYTKEGNPKHKIKSVGTGELRDTDLRDAKKHNLYYSVSDIISIPREYWLERYKKNQILDAAYESTRLPKDKWVEMVLEKADEHRKSTQDIGNKVHQAFENYYKEGILNDETKDYILPTINELSLFGKDWESEVTFANNEWGYGGTVDLFSREANIIVDFKTKAHIAFSQKSLKTDKYCMQLAAYSKGTCNSIIKCYNCFIDSEQVGNFRLEEYFKEELEKGYRMFEHLLEYHKLINNYDPTKFKKENLNV